MTHRRGGILLWLGIGLLIAVLFDTLTAAKAWNEHAMAEVIITLDGKPYSNRDVTLRQQGEILTNLPPAGEGRYAGDWIADGDYEVYLDGENTTRILSVNEGAGSVSVSLLPVYFYDGKTLCSTAMIPMGGCVSEPSKKPEKKGSTFAGWMTAEWESYDFSKAVNGSMSLYASWEVDDQKVDIALDGIGVQGSTTIEDGGSCTVKLVPEDGMMLPQTLTATMDGKPFTDFTYDSETGELKIPAGAVNGALSFEGSSTEVQNYTVTSSVQNCLLYGSMADNQAGYSGKLVPNVGYTLPNTIQVTVGGLPVSFTYRGDTGEVTLSPKVVTGDVHISGVSSVGIQASQYRVIASVGHGTAVVLSDSSMSMLEVEIQPDAGYSCPDNVLVMVGSKIFTDFTYHSETGLLQIGSGKVGQVMIAAVCGSTVNVTQGIHEDGRIPLIVQ